MTTKQASPCSIVTCSDLHPYRHRFFQFYCHHLLSKIGEILNDFSNKCECARCPVIRILLHEAKETGGHDSRAQEAEEEGGTDQAFTDVLLAPAQALLLPRCKYLLQLTREHAEKQETRK